MTTAAVADERVRGAQLRVLNAAYFNNQTLRTTIGAAAFDLNVTLAADVVPLNEVRACVWARSAAPRGAARRCAVLCSARDAARVRAVGVGRAADRDVRRDAAREQRGAGRGRVCGVRRGRAGAAAGAAARAPCDALAATHVTSGSCVRAWRAAQLGQLATTCLLASSVMVNVTTLNANVTIDELSLRAHAMPSRCGLASERACVRACVRAPCRALRGGAERGVRSCDRAIVQSCAGARAAGSSRAWAPP